MSKSLIAVFLMLSILSSGFSPSPIEINNSEGTPLPPPPLIEADDILQNPPPLDQLKLESSHSILAPAELRKKIDIAVTSSEERDPKVAYCGGDNYLAVYTVGNGAIGNIYGQRVNSDGELVGSAFRINIVDTSGRSFSPDVACEWSHNRFIVVWSYNFNGGGVDYDIHAQAVDGVHNGGNQLIGGLIDLTYSSAKERDPSIACNRIDSVCLVTYDNNGSGNGDIYGIRIVVSATAISAPYASFLIGDSGVAETQSDVAWGITNENFMVVWQYQRDVTPDPDKQMIYYAMIYDHNQVGTQIKKGGTALIGYDTEPNDQLLPSVAYNPSDNNFFIAFTYETSPSNSDIIGKYMYGDGEGTLGIHRYYANTANNENSHSVAWNGGAEALSSGAGSDQYTIAYRKQESDGSDSIMDQIVTGTYNSPYVIGSPLILYQTTTSDDDLMLPVICGNSDTGRYLIAWDYYDNDTTGHWEILGMIMIPYEVYLPTIIRP